jgi:predicted dinucleotide-binding enzyme
MKIAVIGAGNVGGTLGRRWSSAGHEVVFGVRDPGAEKIRRLIAACAEGTSAALPADAAADAEVVVLAIWWHVAEEVIRGLGDLAGKILIDCTNPLDEKLQLTHGHTESGGEMIADWAPTARVVKAFNTVPWEAMADPEYGGQRPTLFFCGGDEFAAETVRGLILDIGFEPCYVGGIEMSRYLEPLAALWIMACRVRQPGSDFAFRLIGRNGEGPQ